jgi:PIN domain nuclease of toxin-antitoxin system
VRLLLDTHALVWFTHGDPKLTPAARSAIQDAANEVLISPASYWEIAIKVHLGKWTLNQPYPNFISEALTVYGFHILPILPEHTARRIGLPNHHRDPFDRLLVAQALKEGLPVVSSDATLDLYGVPRVWD